MNVFNENKQQADSSPRKNFCESAILFIGSLESFSTNPTKENFGLVLDNHNRFKETYNKLPAELCAKTSSQFTQVSIQFEQIKLYVNSAPHLFAQLGGMISTMIIAQLNSMINITKEE